MHGTVDSPENVTESKVMTPAGINMFLERIMELNGNTHFLIVLERQGKEAYLVPVKTGAVVQVSIVTERLDHVFLEDLASLFACWKLKPLHGTVTPVGELYTADFYFNASDFTVPANEVETDIFSLLGVLEVDIVDMQDQLLKVMIDD